VDSLIFDGLQVLQTERLVAERHLTR
jgi:hypothetical protein